MKKILSANFVFSIGFFALVGTNLSTSIAADKTIVPRMVEAKANVEPTNQFGLGDNLIVKVDNLDALVEAAAKANKKLILYLNRMPLTGLYPEVVDVKMNEVVFHVSRTAPAKATWDAIYRSSHIFQSLLTPVSVSVGLEGEAAIESPLVAPHTFYFVVIRKWSLISCFFFMLVILIGLWWYAINSTILRDSGPPRTDAKQNPYSLGRTQMAFWFVLVLGSFLLIWAITGELPGLPESVLGLTGISAGTALGARIIDAQNQTVPVATGGFMRDILTDANGVTIHRFQIVVWTIFLGFVFVVYVWNNLALRDFDGTLLALMGVSSGTYLGFKIPERHA